MYREIAADDRVKLRVIFAEAGPEARFDEGFGQVVQWQSDILDGYESTVVDATPADRARAVVAKLAEFAPDVVYVHGYAQPYLRAAMRWARSTGVAVTMTTDSELLHPRPWYVRAMKRLALPWVLRDVDVFLTVGDENERYFAHYGVSRERFHRVSFSIDSKVFDRALARRDEVRRQVRARLGIAEDAMVVLTVGKLIPRKEQADLVRAMLELAKTGQRDVVLVIAGEGVERARLEELARPLGDAVKMPGFVGVDELPSFYAAADVYAHPSSFDPHPLSISEAIYCGLPVVASDRVGSVGANDDVQAGNNGWVYPAGDVAALTGALAELLDSPEARRRAGVESKRLGQSHAADECAKRFVDGAMLALARRKRRPILWKRCT